MTQKIEKEEQSKPKERMNKNKSRMEGVREHN